MAKKGADVNHASGAYRATTPLMIAAGRGRADTAKLLLQHGANLNARDAFGHTALDWAVMGKQAAVIHLLQRAGAKQ